MPLASEVIEAWEEGTVGWAGAKTSLNGFETGMSFVLHLERGDWKVVHAHRSLPKTDEELWGKTLTVSLEELGDVDSCEQGTSTNPDASTLEESPRRHSRRRGPDESFLTDR